jgi:GT2 family glycosyltransferase
MPDPAGPSQPPRDEGLALSALLVVRNEEAHARACAGSLLDQEGIRPDEYELIVVDGMSTDGTRQAMERLATEHAGRVRVLDNPRLLLASGWNIAIAAARAPLVVRLDAHARPAGDFLAKSLLALREHPDFVAAGGVMRTVGEGFWGKVISAALSSRFGVGGSTFRVGGRPGEADTAVFALYRRQALLDVGGFDETLKRNQDLVCHARLKSAGGRFYFDPAIRSTYYCRTSLGTLAKQMYRNGHWLPLTFKHHVGKTLSVRHLLPLFFTSGILGSLIAGIAWPWALLPLAAVLVAHQACAVVAARSTDLPARGKALFPLTVFVMHFCYGMGWLTGLARLPFYHPSRKD